MGLPRALMGFYSFMVLSSIGVAIIVLALMREYPSRDPAADRACGLAVTSTARRFGIASRSARRFFTSPYVKARFARCIRSFHGARSSFSASLSVAMRISANDRFGSG